jgi:outer membrane protein insertion porin family
MKKTKPISFQNIPTADSAMQKLFRDTVYKVSPNRINIEITIEEGSKYFFRNITWVGNTKHSSQELSNILGIKKGDVF